VAGQRKKESKINARRDAGNRIREMLDCSAGAQKLGAAASVIFKVCVGSERKHLGGINAAQEVKAHSTTTVPA
jgi:hypothetical protein